LSRIFYFRAVLSQPGTMMANVPPRRPQSGRHPPPLESITDEWMDHLIWHTVLFNVAVDFLFVVSIITQPIFTVASAGRCHTGSGHRRPIRIRYERLYDYAGRSISGKPGQPLNHPTFWQGGEVLQFSLVEYVLHEPVKLGECRLYRNQEGWRTAAHLISIRAVFANALRAAHTAPTQSAFAHQNLTALPLIPV
jgi:hypothetical protein